MKGEAKQVEELLPCPFCGGEARLHSFIYSSDLTTYIVVCSGCESKSVMKSDKDFVCESWNARTASAQDGGEGKSKLETFIETYGTQKDAADKDHWNLLFGAFCFGWESSQPQLSRAEDGGEGKSKLDEIFGKVLKDLPDAIHVFNAFLNLPDGYVLLPKKVGLYIEKDDLVWNIDGKFEAAHPQIVGHHTHGYYAVARECLSQLSRAHAERDELKEILETKLSEGFDARFKQGFYYAVDLVQQSLNKKES